MECADAEDVDDLLGVQEQLLDDGKLDLVEEEEVEAVSGTGVPDHATEERVVERKDFGCCWHDGRGVGRHHCHQRILDGGIRWCRR